MNSTQVGDILKAILLALGVSSTALGYFTAEMWAAIGGLIMTLVAFGWTLIAHKTDNLIVAVADDPAVVGVAVSDVKLAQKVAHKTGKVVLHDGGDR